MKTNIEKIQKFFDSMEDMTSESLMAMVENYLTNEDIEMFVAHIEKFYGISDDEELGVLAQIMITGYLAAKAETNEINTQGILKN